MRNIRIVADSSANLLELQNIPFAAAPLKIITGDREFVDDGTLDVDAMVSWFDSYKGKSKTSCPNLIAFGLSKGKVRIAHCVNENAAQSLKDMILAQLPQVDVQIHRCRGLCSYYAEKGGLLVGFEKL